MEDLKSKFKKETVAKQRILIAALLGVIAGFLPWFSISFGAFGGASVNGWHSYGLFTTLASLAIVLDWLLPKVGVKYKLPWKEDVLLKILSLSMIAGPVLWIIQVNFTFSTVGIGVYTAVVAAIVALFYAFSVSSKKKKS